MHDSKLKSKWKLFGHLQASQSGWFLWRENYYISVIRIILSAEVRSFLSFQSLELQNFHLLMRFKIMNRLVDANNLFMSLHCSRGNTQNCCPLFRDKRVEDIAHYYCHCTEPGYMYTSACWPYLLTTQYRHV